MDVIRTVVVAELFLMFTLLQTSVFLLFSGVFIPFMLAKSSFLILIQYFSFVEAFIYPVDEQFPTLPGQLTSISSIVHFEAFCHFRDADPSLIRIGYLSLNTLAQSCPWLNLSAYFLTGGNFAVPQPQIS